MTAATIELPGAGQDGVPEAGQLVQVRGQHWVVSGVARSHQPVDEFAASRLPGQALVTLTSINDDDLGQELTGAWEVEQGRELAPATKLPQVSEDGWDDPQRLGAFLDALRWGPVTSADTRTLEGPVPVRTSCVGRDLSGPAGLFVFGFMLQATVLTVR